MTTALAEEAPPVTAADAPRTLTRIEAADLLGVSITTVDRYAREGLLVATRNRVTRRVTFDAAEVEQLRRERDGE